MLFNRNQKAFTLIELMIVIMIIGVLAAIAIPMYRAQTFKAKLVEVTNSMGAVATAAHNYYIDNYTWPPDNADAAAIGTNLGIYVPTSRADWSTGGSPTRIQATIRNISASNPTIDGCFIQLVASTTAVGAITWSWTSDLPSVYYQPIR